MNTVHRTSPIATYILEALNAQGDLKKITTTDKTPTAILNCNYYLKKIQPVSHLQQNEVQHSKVKYLYNKLDYSL